MTFTFYLVTLLCATDPFNVICDVRNNYDVDQWSEGCLCFYPQMALRCTYVQVQVPDPYQPGVLRTIFRIRDLMSSSPSPPPDYNPGSTDTVPPTGSTAGRRFTWRSFLVPDPNRPDAPRIILRRIPASQRRTGSSTRCDPSPPSPWVFSTPISPLSSSSSSSPSSSSSSSPSSSSSSSPSSSSSSSPSSSSSSSPSSSSSSSRSSSSSSSSSSWTIPPSSPQRKRRYVYYYSAHFCNKAIQSFLNKTSKALRQKYSSTQPQGPGEPMKRRLVLRPGWQFVVQQTQNLQIVFQSSSNQPQGPGELLTVSPGKRRLVCDHLESEEVRNRRLNPACRNQFNSWWCHTGPPGHVEHQGQGGSIKVCPPKPTQGPGEALKVSPPKPTQGPGEALKVSPGECRPLEDHPEPEWARNMRLRQESSVTRRG
ncbi:uncharacterized protein LOC142937804 [Anarhichas minor]|uniref:uncharacterized protein LOC142937804 n=1 Tax=Anarhichas minor TaxID=65739 RepID=UPI003F73D88B